MEWQRGKDLYNLKKNKSIEWQKDGIHVTISNYITVSTSYSHQTEATSLKFTLERVKVYFLL